MIWYDMIRYDNISDGVHLDNFNVTYLSYTIDQLPDVTPTHVDRRYVNGKSMRCAKSESMHGCFK